MAVIYLDRPVQPGDPVGSVYDPGRTQTTNTISGTPQYSGLYGIDLTPEEEAAGFLDVSKAEGTPLHGIPEFEKKFYASRDYGAIPSMYELYLGGGFPEGAAGATDVAQDFTGGQMIDTGGGDAAEISGATDFLTRVPDTGPEQINIDTPLTQMITDPTTGQTQTVRQAMTSDDAYRGVDTTMPEHLTSDMGASSFIDTTPDYSGVRDSKRLDARGTPISEMGTRPPDFVAGAQTFTDPDPRARIDARGTTVTGTRPPEFVTGLDEPVNLVERDYTGRPVIAERADVTLGEQDYTYDPMDPPMLGDTGASMDYMSGALDAPYGVNPNTGEPYQTPRTIADQNRVLGQTLSEQDVDTQGNLLETGINKLRKLLPEDFNFGTTAVKALINKYVGGPITLVADALKGLAEMLPSGIDYTTDKAREIGLLQGDNTVTQDIYGINTQPYYGDYNEYNVDRVEELGSSLKERATDKYGVTFDPVTGEITGDKTKVKEFKDMNTRNLKELEDRQEYVDRSGAGGDIQPDATPRDIETGILTGDAAEAEAIQDLSLIEARDRMADIDTGDAARAERIAAEDRAARIAAPISVPVPRHIRQPDPPDGGGGYSGDPGGGAAGSPFARGGRVRYSKGGIVSLLK